MKLLKIENNDGFFLNANNAYLTMSKITKEDLLWLVDMTINNDDSEFDLYNEELIKNQAHQIIYKHISLKLKNLQERRQEFKDASQRIFLSEYEKYSIASIV